MNLYRLYRRVNDYLYTMSDDHRDAYQVLVASAIGLAFGAASLWIILEVKP